MLKNPSISRNLTIGLCIIVLLLSSLGLFINYAIQMKKGRTQLLNRGSEYVHSISDALKFALWNLNLENIEIIAKAYSNNELIVKLLIFNASDEILFSYDDSNHYTAAPENKKIIVYEGDKVGSIHLNLTDVFLKQSHRQMLLTGIITITITLLSLLGLTSLLLRLFLQKPLNVLSSIAKHYAEGKYHTGETSLVHVEFKNFFLVLSAMGNKIQNQMKTLTASNMKLMAAEAKYRSIFENAIEGLFQLSSAGTVISANPALSKIMGYDSRQSIKNDINIITEHLFVNQNEQLDFFNDLSTKEQLSGLIIKGTRRNGSYFWGELTIRNVLGSDNTFLYYEGSLIDITERKNREKAEIDRKAAQAAAQARSVFLNNSGQGFLSFGPDFLVEKEYSRECEKIFEHAIANVSIADLLYPIDAVSRANLEKNLVHILSEEDNYKQELYLSLLKKEYLVEDKFVEAEYRVIAENKMMLILTDVTPQKKLENEVKSERNRLKFVVSAIRESNYFFEILDDFKQFENYGFQALIASKNDLTKILAELYRIVHTFKGLFAQQDFPNITVALHKMEDKLSKIRQNTTETAYELSDLMNTYGCLKALNKDLAIIEEILGKDYLKKKERRNEVSISREQAKKIEVMAQKLIDLEPGLIDEDTRDLLRETEKILHINIKDLIGFYLNSAIKLAERLKKDINRFGVEGDDVFVDTPTYSPFIRTLVHVFRNAVDHGIETSEEREEHGKEEDAELICSIKKIDGKQTGERVIISISDNGRGLDTSRILEKAVERGILTREEAPHIPAGKIHKIIFNGNFSTNENVTELSGRGVGLDSVRAELDKLGGDIEIDTEPGKGTTFQFSIPLVGP